MVKVFQLFIKMYLFQDPINQSEIKIDDLWGKLFQIMEQLSPKLGWHLGFIFSKPW